MRFISLLILGLLLPTGTLWSQGRGASRRVVRNVRLSQPVRVATPGIVANRGARNRARPVRRVTRSNRGPQHGLRGNRGRRGVDVRFGRGGVHVRFGGRRSPRRRSCGYWRTITERVWVPPVYEWRRDACGRYYRVCVTPGHYEHVTRRVWVNR